jgi:hypothetical protein
MQPSKSDHLMFLMYSAWMWLKKHDKSKLPPIDANAQAIPMSELHAYAQTRLQPVIDQVIRVFDR